MKTLRIYICESTKDNTLDTVRHIFNNAGVKTFVSGNVLILVTNRSEFGHSFYNHIIYKNGKLYWRDNINNEYSISPKRLEEFVKTYLLYETYMEASKKSMNAEAKEYYDKLKHFR